MVWNRKMNSLAIQVEQFGPLENVNFKLAPLMVFTGLSSTGKSYANYLVYYFLSKICNGEYKDFFDKGVDFSLQTQVVTFRLDDYLLRLEDEVQDFMRRFLGDDTIICKAKFISRLRNRECAIEIRKNDIVDDELATPAAPPKATYTMLVNGHVRNERATEYLVETFAVIYVRNYLLGYLLYRSLIYPPGRGSFVGENFSLKKEVASSMDMYNAYFRDYDYGLRNYAASIKSDLPTKLLEKTSGGDLMTVDGKQFLQLDENHRIALSASASSVKDMSPWLFFLKNHPSEYCAFCLEEPEAHQHPSVTVQIADVISTLLQRGNIFHVTTHSDYLIQRINQLIKLGYVRSNSPSLFEEICRKQNMDLSCFIDASDVSAYYFSKGKNGKTVVKTMNVDEKGIPMTSFFEVVRDLNEREREIDEIIYRMNK